MGSRFVRPDVVRLPLADVARRAHAALLAQKKPKETVAAIAQAAERLAVAEAAGDWVDVKQRLNVGEQRAAFALMSTQIADGSMRVNRLYIEVGFVVSYLIDWSLTDDAGHLVEIKGQPADVVQAAVDALDPADFAEIHAAIEAHELAQIEKRAQEKKRLAGLNAAAPTSSSPSGGASPSSTSDT